MTAAVPRRMWATVAFTDIVGSTRLAAELGDAAWRRRLDLHDEVTRVAAAMFGGRIWKWTGDGALLTFGSPGDAIRCVAGIRRVMARHGVEVRAGVHVGTVDVRGGDICGLSVNIAARVAAAARPAGILVTRAVVDMTDGGDVMLVADGDLGLTEVAGEWPVFRVVATDQPRTGQHTSVVCASRSSGSPVGR